MLRCALFWSFPLLLACGCTQLLAERVVKAPNRQTSVGRGVDAPGDELKNLYIDEQLRVKVGPPDASISVWITDPTLARETITLDKKGRAIIQRKPTTSPATQPLVTRGTVFLLHGIADRKEFGPYMIYREILAHDGYRVVQVDLRGHGRSTGDFITFGVVESRDLVQLLDTLESQGKIIGSVGVLGVSYGASVAIEWAAIDPRIKAIVGLEPFATFRQVSHDAAPVTLGLKRFFFSKSDIDKAVNLAGKLAGFDPDEADAVRAIKETRAAVLLIHSRADQLIPYAHSERLYDAAAGDRRLLLLDGASHFDMWVTHLETIQTATLAWLKAKLSRPSGSVAIEAIPYAAHSACDTSRGHVGTRWEAAARCTAF